MDVSHNAITRILARSRVPRLYESLAIDPLDESLGTGRWSPLDAETRTLCKYGRYYIRSGFEVDGQPFKLRALGPANGSTISLVSL
jgi:hypothetical protein